MKKIIAGLAMLTMVGIANADTIVIFTNGGFDSPLGAKGPWNESGPVAFSYPTTGGNPGGYGVMDATTGDPWGVWVAGDATPLPINPMGLVAGGTYNFVQDMITITDGAGFNGGVKIESWGPSGKISDSGDMRAGAASASWATYSFSYTIAAGATGIKVVPLWSQNDKVGYDNIGVVVPPQALTAAITSPADSETVSSISFPITATAVISPGTVTNVAFYDGATLIGNDNSYPYSFTYAGAPLGARALTAVAKDSNGNSATSAVVNVTVAFIAPPPLDYPIVNAPTPTRPPASVISIYNSSATYPSVTVNNWHNAWGDHTGITDFTIIPAGSVVKKYIFMNYIGAEVVPINASGMTTFHVDVWTPNANQFQVKLITTTGEAEVLLTSGSGIITSNNWISLDIPLSAFLAINPAMSLNNINNFLWANNAGGGTQDGTFFIDNIYFWTTNGVKTSIALGKQVGWTASSGNNYQPQKSVNGTTWSNLGAPISGVSVTSAFDPAPVPFYQVQEITPATLAILNNGGFETDDGGVGALNWSPAGTYSPTRITTDFHTGTACMDLNVTGPAGSSVAQQGLVPITGGASYTFSAWSKLAATGQGFSAFALVQWFDGSSAFISQAQVNLTPVLGTWTQNTGSAAAPANATQVQVQVVANTGATLGDNGDLHLDDVSLTTPGGTSTTNILSATVQPGVGVTWKSGVGRTYEVDAIPNLSPSSTWSPFGGLVLGTGTYITVADGVTSSSKFYRVLEIK